MIDFKEEAARAALREFVKTQLQREGKDPIWLVAKSRLSRETVMDRMLARDQSNKPAPRQTTLNKLFSALDCQFEDFEEYFLSAHRPHNEDELKDIESLVGEMRQLIADTKSQTHGAATNLGSEGAPTPSVATHRDTCFGSERRQLTVVMYDIVDWTALSQRLDAEDLAELLVAYRDICGASINKFGGTVAEYVGDGVLAYFGHPVAHEDDAERAIRAALDAVSRIKEVPCDQCEINVRCGVATGIMVVGDLTSRTTANLHDSKESRSSVSSSAIGEAPSLATRLQKLAEPNAVVISERTQRLVKNIFSYRDLGSFQLKGIDKPVRAWRVVSERVIRSRYSALRLPVLAPLIGRSSEVKRLSRFWDVAREGVGRIAVITGDAGVGKSRLAETVAEQIVSADCRQFWYYCSPHLQNSALAPLINHLMNAADFSPDDSPREKLEKLERIVPGSLTERDEAMALFSRLLYLEANDRYSLPPMSPQRQRRRLFDALFRMLVTLTENRPGLIVFEDLHWMDPSLDQLLGRLVYEIRTLPILVILTARTEFQSHWEDLDNVDVLKLNPLSRMDSEALIKEVSAQGDLPEELVTRIVDKTDGVPLFIEDVTLEFSRALSVRSEENQARQRPSIEALKVPDTLNDSLMSRLDRLGSEAKRLVQIGATIGREFALQLLVDVAEMDNERIKSLLFQLENADVLHACRTPPALVYVFKHALVQDAAYASLLKRERKQLHLRLAEALEDGYPETCDQTPELLAYHFEEAGENSSAADYWFAAGKRSTKRSSFIEALDQLERALRLTRTLPASEPRTQRELEILIILGAAQAGYRGFSAPESGNAYMEALDLCRDLGNPPEVCSILSGAGSFYITRAEFGTCRELANECLARANEQTTNPPFVMGHRLLGGTLFLTGEFLSAIEHLEEALSRYESDPKLFANPELIMVQDHKSTVSCYLALAHTVLGDLDRGLRAARLGLAHAESLRQPHTINFSLTYLAAVHHCRREFEKVLEYARRSHQMALDQGFGTWVGIAQMMVGAALVSAGDPEKGMREISRGIEAYSSTEATTYKPFGISLLGSSLLAVGKLRESMEAIDKATAIAEISGENWYVPELWRLKGAVTLELGDIPRGQDHLKKSIKLAQQSGAAFWELRSATLLARSMNEQHLVEEARCAVIPVFQRFTEGLDTPDLHEAASLVATLEETTS